MGEEDAGPLETSGSARLVVERPPPGLARGRYPWPAWGVELVASLLILLVLTYFALRAWQARRRRT